jgi:murein DD-endopeptidase MepM/ murein hydrolase activator NlpD
MKRRYLFATLVIGLVVVFAAVLLFRRLDPLNTSQSNNLIAEYLYNPERRAPLMNAALEQCPNAPFALPSSGLIGLMYADTARPYSTTRQHTGIDIFGNGDVGTVPIYAAYDGWLTRLPDWKSSVIIRHDDPLQAGRTIWTYYTHMASEDGNTSYIVPQFPADTREMPVKKGTLLGFQGLYAGTGGAIAMHLHFSVVLADSAGSFLNEAELGNTLDPSPYFGMKMRLADDTGERPLRCET